MPDRIGRYEILAELGRGGMATVYLGRAAGVGGVRRLFAIKMIHRHLARDERFVRLFMNEARIAARLHHPNVVPVYEVETEAGTYSLSMDYVSGETLGYLLQHTWNEDRPFPSSIAVQIVAGAAEGLHAAHELKDDRGQLLGVVHRDVAPKNLLVGYDGVVRVMDFGIARAMDSLGHTNPGVIRGTAPYMTPEQVLGEAVDRRTDVFALGIVLFESTLGQRLFKAENEPVTLQRVLDAPIPRPSSIDPDYPPRLQSIVLKALERNREQRFQSARELSDSLLDFLLSEGKRPSAGEIQTFMLGLLGDRYTRRQRLELDSNKLSPRAATEVIRGLMSPVGIEPYGAHRTTREAPVLNKTVVERAPKPPEEVLRRNAPTQEVPLVAKQEAKAGAQEGTSERDALGAKPSEPLGPSPALAETARSPSGSVPSGSVPSGSVPSGSVPSGSVPFNSAPSRLDGSVESIESIAELAATSRPKAPMAVLSGLALAALIAFLTYGGRTEEAEPVVRAPEDAGPPPTISLVELRVRVRPDHAAVTVDDQPYSEPMLLPRSPKRVLVKASADGFAPKEESVELTDSRELSMSLVPSKPVAPPASPAPRPETPRVTPKPRRELPVQTQARSPDAGVRRSLFRGDEI